MNKHLRILSEKYIETFEIFSRILVISNIASKY